MTCSESKVVEFNMVLHTNEVRQDQASVLQNAFGLSSERAKEITTEARTQHGRVGSYMVRCTAAQFGLFILLRNKLEIKNRVAELDATLIEPQEDSFIDLRPGRQYT